MYAFDAYDFFQSIQPTIGSTAASEVQHSSGSYAAVAPGT